MSLHYYNLVYSTLFIGSQQNLAGTLRPYWLLVFYWLWCIWLLQCICLWCFIGYGVYGYGVHGYGVLLAMCAHLLLTADLPLPIHRHRRACELLLDIMAAAADRTSARSRCSPNGRCEEQKGRAQTLSPFKAVCARILTSSPPSGRRAIARSRGNSWDSLVHRPLALCVFRFLIVLRREGGHVTSSRSTSKRA